MGSRNVRSWLVGSRNACRQTKAQKIEDECPTSGSSEPEQAAGFQCAKRYGFVALALSEYGKLEDGSFFGRIPSCIGVVAFDSTLKECVNELRSTLED
jgi:hypothetical protein